MKKERLSKRLARSGVCSRRTAEEFIFEGRVKVNGHVTLVPQTPVDFNDTIHLDGKKIGKHEKKLYYILNKPKGYICSANPLEKNRLVVDIFEKIPERLFTVGRLDKDTTGLLIVTNDGYFAQKVIHPSFDIQKEYVAKVAHEITDTHLKLLTAGLYIERTFIKPHKVAKVRRGTIKIVVKEGKKREVRSMLEAVGLEKIVSLKRTRIGSLQLGTLPIGSFRLMTSQEKETLFK